MNKKKIAAVAAAVAVVAAPTAGWQGAKDVYDASHIGAPPLGYPCPPGHPLYETWVAGNPGASNPSWQGSIYYNGYTEYASCQGQVQAGFGTGK